MKTCLPKHTWNLCTPFFFFGGKQHKMLVLNSKKKKAPDWLFPECGILDPLRSFTGCAMTSSGPPKLAPHTQAHHSPGMEEPEDYRHPSHSQMLSDSTFINCHSTPLPPEWVTQTARYSQRFWQLSLEQLGRVWLDWKTHPAFRDSSQEKACTWWRIPTSTLSRLSSLSGNWFYQLTRRQHNFQSSVFYMQFSTLPVILRNLTGCYQFWKVLTDTVLPSWHKSSKCVAGDKPPLKSRSSTL